MIRLTDEGIRQELAKLPNTNLFLPSAYEESSIGWNEFIAKAQLKSIAEWLDNYEVVPSETQTIELNTIEGLRQTLLEEIKDV